MSRKKVAVFVDWENVRKGVFEEAGRRLHREVSYNSTENVLRFIKSFINPEEEEIYRIFVYLTEPFTGTIGGVDYTTMPAFTHSMNFIDRLQVEELVAVRKGKIAYRGQDRDNRPIFIQKQVDMILGLDVAHVAHHRLADRALILTLDTDCVPAMKAARISGMQVMLAFCPDIQHEISKELRKHADFVRRKDFGAIFPERDSGKIPPERDSGKISPLST
jgi:uncharacterized LabA/DUF88 family protein